MRLLHHFEPKKGWMNDPNGLVYFKGQYHAFFQYNPNAPQDGPFRWGCGLIHWGHAVSKDLIHWEELPIALYPDQSYEDKGGCYSGSAIEKDGRLYLFYTSVSHELGQTQSVAWSDDGIHFTKYSDNPIICQNPFNTYDFRDPKVTCIDGKYYMVVGSGDKSYGNVLLYTSEDLLNWRYLSVLFEGSEYTPCVECPDFFKLGEKYVLMFSQINERAIHFAVGDFEDGKLVNYTISTPERGIDFYAPQTFSKDGRRIMIGWMYHWFKDIPAGCPFAGALSIPRELTLQDGRIKNYPVEEAWHLLKKQSPFVKTLENKLVLFDKLGSTVSISLSAINSVDILEDTKTVEVFVNNGEHSFTFWTL